MPNWNLIIYVEGVCSSNRLTKGMEVIETLDHIDPQPEKIEFQKDGTTITFSFYSNNQFIKEKREIQFLRRHILPLVKKHNLILVSFHTIS